MWVGGENSKINERDTFEKMRFFVLFLPLFRCLGWVPISLRIFSAKRSSAAKDLRFTSFNRIPNWLLFGCSATGICPHPVISTLSEIS